jgi:hypothetical protein
MLWKTRGLDILALLCTTACSSDLLTPEEPEDISVHLTVRATVTRGSDRLAGAKVTLSSLTECRDGSGSGNPCTWTTVTDTEGEYSIQRDDLSAGSHTITLNATNSEGLAGADSIQVLVVPASCPDVLIDFETLPDGSPPCPQGSTHCDLENQFLAFGVGFSAKVTPTCNLCSDWKFQNMELLEMSGNERSVVEGPPGIAEFPTGGRP